MTENEALPGRAESYWMDSAPGDPRPPLSEDTTADVVVIGAGIAGLATAWELSRAGRDVVVLEADRVASGVTGHTTAKISALQGLRYSTLRERHGPEAARWYARSQADAVERIAARATELGIGADVERAAAYTYAAGPGSLAAVEAEASAAADAGLDATFVRETPLPFAVAGAVRLEGQAQFHPRTFLLALTADLEAGGARVFERSRAVALHEGTPCRVTTEQGHTVRATDVVVATHYPVFDRAMLFARLSPRRELVVAAPLPEDAAPPGMHLTEDEGKRSVRTAPFGEGRRLLIVTGESFTPGTGDPRARFRRLDAWMHERFPVGPTAYHWAAQDNDPSDTVPLIGPFHPGARHVWVATGFGGWGMTGGFVAARLLTALLTRTEELPPWTALYDPRRLKSLVREGTALLGQQAEVARHFLGDRARVTHVDAVTDIPAGTGAVVRIGGRRCAVHRAEDGTVRAVSARCTHLGCLVAYNQADRTWECPCHGSRFGLDGEVLQGPAVRPLAPVELPAAPAERPEGEGQR